MSEPRTEDKEGLLARLRRVEGQIRGIQRMIEEERDCESVVTQLMAARAALDRTSLLIVNHHLAQCLLDGEGQTNRAHLERIVEFLLRFSNASSDAAGTGGDSPSQADTRSS
jgi:DNA-binding FrmR family transcriptional regulator